MTGISFYCIKYLLNIQYFSLKTLELYLGNNSTLLQLIKSLGIYFIAAFYHI